MTLAVEAQFIALDFETTGVVDDLPSVPWQIGMVFVDGGKIAEAYRFSRLLNPGDRPFNPYAPGRHAVLREELAQAPTLVDLWPEIAPWLGGRPILAHNVATERTVLADAFPLHEFGPWIDTLALARRAYPNLPSYKLEDLIPNLGLQERLVALCSDLAPHDALYDAMAAGLFLEHLLTQPGWAAATLHDLAQIRGN